MRYDLAKEITQRLKLRDVMEFYGIQFNGRGFAKCPFHSEKTASLSIKNGHYKCFGCGAYGGVIDFVMNYFGLQFRQALLKLDGDFSLGLVSSKKLTYRERIRMSENRQLERVYQMYKEKLHQNYLAICAVHSVLFRQLCNGDESVRGTVEELDNILDDFSGEEARLWMEMLM